MKGALLFTALLLCSHLLWAQSTAAIKGTITNEKEQPLANISITVVQTGHTALTEQDGFFLLPSLNPGHYQLKITGVGIVSKSRSVNLSSNDTLKINIQVKDTTIGLKEITITSGRNRFASSNDMDIARMPLADLENPQAYTVITRELFKEQMAVDYSDIFKNISGSEIPVFANNGRMDISSRGFKVRSQIVDGISAYTMTSIDPANIEKVEVLKGPSATLFGSSLTSYGGVVNIVTKRPYDHFGTNLSYTHGSFGLNRLSLDINTPVNKKHTVLFRLNAAGESRKSWQDAGFSKSIFVAPSLSWKINDRLSLDADMDYYARKATSPYWLVPYKKSSIRNAGELPIDFSRSFTRNDIFYTADQLNFRVRLHEQISKHWTGTTILSSTTNNIQGNMLSLKGTSDSMLTHSVQAGPQRFSTFEIQQNFLHELKVKNWHNRLLAGIDFYHYADDQSVATVQVDTVNFVHPDEASMNGSFNRSTVENALAGAGFKKTATAQNTFSVYVSDVISLNERWFVMASLRLDHFQNEGVTDKETEAVTGAYQQTALSPKLGLVYQPLKNRLSVFANYMNGFQNVNGSDYYGHSFMPQQASQTEAGIKLNMLRNRLSVTVSAYNILVYKILRDDPDHSNFSIQDGTELSRGVEFSAIYNPVSGLNLIAGYAYNYCIYQKANDKLLGMRPDGAGPSHTANLWVSYKLTYGQFSGLGIGGGGIYGSNLETIKSFSSTFIVPEYTVLDATLFYEHAHYRIGVKLNNLTNQRYWNNRLGMQPPRSYSVNLTLSL